jgi:chromosome segregation ATPase
LKSINNQLSTTVAEQSSHHQYPANINLGLQREKLVTDVQSAKVTLQAKHNDTPAAPTKLHGLNAEIIAARERFDEEQRKLTEVQSKIKDLTFEAHEAHANDEIIRLRTEQEKLALEVRLCKEQASQSQAEKSQLASSLEAATNAK